MQSPSDLVDLVAAHIAADEPDLYELLLFMQERLQAYAVAAHEDATTAYDDPELLHERQMMSRAARNLADAAVALGQAAVLVSCAIAAQNDAEYGDEDDEDDEGCGDPTHTGEDMEECEECYFAAYRRIARDNGEGEAE